MQVFCGGEQVVRKSRVGRKGEGLHTRAVLIFLEQNAESSGPNLLRFFRHTSSLSARNRIRISSTQIMSLRCHLLLQVTKGIIYQRALSATLSIRFTALFRMESPFLLSRL